MRNWLSCLLAVGILFSSFVPVQANGIFVAPGAKANGLGGAFYAIADDATAIYWNPAGIAQLDKGVMGSAMYINGTATSNTSLGNKFAADKADGDFPLPKIYDPAFNPLLPGPGEPSSYESKELKTAAVLPFIAGYMKYSDITFALGYYASGGGMGKWEDTVAAGFTGTDALRASLDNSFYFLLYNVTAAKEIMPNLSAGIGVDLVTMTNTTEVKKTFIATSGSPLPNYDIMYDKNSTGNGIQVNGGLIYMPMEKLSTGLTVRSGTTIKLSGKAKMQQTGVPGFPALFESNFDEEYVYPFTIGLGLAYYPTEAWTLAAGAVLNKYSWQKNKITYKTPAPGLLGQFFPNADTSAGWKDTTQLQVGGEYRLNEQWAFRAGVQTDPSPAPTDKLTLLNTQQYSLTTANIGAGYSFSRLTVNLTLARSFSDKLEKAPRTFEYPVDIALLELQYAF